MNKLLKGDCLIESDKIESGSVDLILTDLPYGTVKDIKNVNHGMSGKCEWDVIIDTDKIMKVANRILRKNGKMILTAQQPFTNELINKSLPNLPFNYSMIWEKDHFANALTAKKAPLNYYEDVLVFSKHFESENNDDNPCKKYALKVFEYINKPMKYLKEFYSNNNLSHFYSNGKQFRLCTEPTYNNLIKDFKLNEMNGFLDYPILKEMNRDYKNKFASTFNLWEGNKYKSNILKYKKDYTGHHPTQKPVLLLEDLIKTFSNENDLVVDLTMGSGSTGVACKNTNRNFIGIEKDENYFEIAKKRIDETEYKLF
jgi:DNA modification methylase